MYVSIIAIYSYILANKHVIIRNIFTPAVISARTSLYPFGQSEGDTSLQLQPNGLSPPFVLSQPFPFLGTNQSTLFVSTLPPIRVPSL